MSSGACITTFITLNLSNDVSPITKRPLNIHLDGNWNLSIIIIVISICKIYVIKLFVNNERERERRDFILFFGLRNKRGERLIALDKKCLYENTKGWDLLESGWKVEY